MSNRENELKAWVVTVDMGLGHQRATYPFTSIAEGGILTVGEKSGCDPEEQKIWRRMRGTYEFISRARTVPIIGPPLFNVLDWLQSIPPFYPIRDRSTSTAQVRLLTRMIGRGLCRGLVQTLQSLPLPLLTSYLVPAIAADQAGYGRIYCIICDAEFSRAWVPENPRRSRIHYLAPCGRAVMRLKSYGVPDERIFLTGFPIPFEVLGDANLSFLRHDAAQRLFYLDPKERFWPLHGRNVVHFLGKKNCVFQRARVLTITFAVGGAGAQAEIGIQIARSLRGRLARGEVQLNLVAGVRPEVRDQFESLKRDLLPDSPNLRVVFGSTREEYFRRFSETIRETDVLWTKPSELSFFCGLGIPVIVAPPIGAQEVYNRHWLLEVQAGIPQEDPQYTDQWLFDLLAEGRLAESAWDGFLTARKYGSYKILEVLETGTMGRETSPLKR
jgi:hypothetical protein